MTYESIKNEVTPIFVELWESVFASMEANFPDAYPAHIFKNVGRLKELI